MNRYSDFSTTVPVSVIIPCFRCADTIERAVESIAAQAMLPAEVILVDDCSGDDTLETLFAIQRKYPEGWIRVLQQPVNGGPGEARNAGWDHASHTYVAFLDADDSWHPQKIEIQYRWMREHPEVALTGHGNRKLAEGELPLREASVDPAEVVFRPISKNQLLWSNRFSTPSVMLRRDMPMRFARGKHHSEDYLLWLTVACAGYRMARCDLPLAFLYKAAYGEGGLSSQLWKMEKGELDTYRTVRKACGISQYKYALLLAWSMARFLRRVVVTGFRP